MPNRMLRDWTDSDKMNAISVHAERFFTRLIMKVDDYGCFYADTRLLKANLFPLLLDVVREADITRWMAECRKAGLIVLYEASGKKYLQILDFKQRLDRAKAKHPLPPKDIGLCQSVNDCREVVNDSPPEIEVEVEKKRNRANALVAAEPATAPGKRDYEKIVEQIKGKPIPEVVAGLKDFLSRRPTCAEPYVDYWNLAVKDSRIPQVEVISESRRKQLKVRLQEDAFDFVEIVRKIRASWKLKNESEWFSFDWVFKNDKNYLKILEGNYD